MPPFGNHSAGYSEPSYPVCVLRPNVFCAYYTKEMGIRDTYAYIRVKCQIRLFTTFTFNVWRKRVLAKVYVSRSGEATGVEE